MLTFKWFWHFVTIINNFLLVWNFLPIISCLPGINQKKVDIEIDSDLYIHARNLSHRRTKVVLFFCWPFPMLNLFTAMFCLEILRSCSITVVLRISTRLRNTNAGDIVAPSHNKSYRIKLLVENIRICTKPRETTNQHTFWYYVKSDKILYNKFGYSPDSPARSLPDNMKKLVLYNRTSDTKQAPT